MTSTQEWTLAASKCEVAFDNRTRQLYATDASLYQIEPAAVAFPQSAQEARDVILSADSVGLSVSPRGAGSGLAGGAIGDGLIAGGLLLRARRHRAAPRATGPRSAQGE
ncbi:hypothetical protein BH20VER3_BH20VER3_24150 [soil metagenome]